MIYSDLSEPGYIVQSLNLLQNPPTQCINQF